MKHPTFNELLPILQASAGRWVPSLDVDTENESALRYVLAWSCAHPRFDGDPGKGLLLMGHKGTGKTLMMRALGPCLAPDLRYTMHNTRKVTSAYNCEGDEGIKAYTAPRHMLFDDLGDERMGQHYGDKVEVMALVIQDRYELFIDHGIMSHFTTNLKPDEIKDRYGDRVYSRLLHMVNSVRVGSAENATDRRVTAKAPERKQAEAQAHEAASEEVAAEGFRRVREVIAAAARTIDMPKLEVVRRTQESDVREFAQRIKGRPESELREALENLRANYQEAEAGPFIAAIQSELASTKNSTAA